MSRTMRDRRGRLLVGAIGFPLALALLIDLSDMTAWYQLPVYVAVAVLALVGLNRRSPTLMAVALAACLIATIVMAATAPLFTGEGPVPVEDAPSNNIGLVEVGALLLVIADRWRAAARVVDWVLAAGAVVTVLALVLRKGVANQGYYPDDTVILIVLVALAVILGAVMRSQDTQRRTAMAAVRRDERLQIARELHDVVAHHVTGIVVATQAAQVVAGLRATPPTDTASRALRAIEDSGSQALAAMRTLVGVLRTEVDATTSPPLSPIPVLSDLGDLVRRFRETGAVGHIEFETLLDGRARIEPELQAAAYRVVQEALTNACRHAFGAAHIRIAVVAASEVLDIEVTNSAGGRSPAPEESVTRTVTVGRPGGGFGLIGMRERVEALGGSLIAGAQPHGGWSVHAAIPLPKTSGTGAADCAPGQNANRVVGGSTEQVADSL